MREQSCFHCGLSIEQNEEIDFDDKEIDRQLHVFRILQELMNNSVRHGKASEIWIVFKIVNGINSCHYEDNGIGFDEIYLDRIFIIFQSLNDRQTYEGTGIGLAIAKKIIEKHNGLITAKSKIGQGASFIIVLPLEYQEIK